MITLNKCWMLGLLLAVVGIFTGTGNASAQSRGPGLYQTFYQELEPYGRWINHREFGRVWVPDVDRDFQPYGSRGRWVITEFGNTWVSDYEWGWAPFHYGRWFNDDYHGWTWVPGRDWAPAWVEWRSGEGYYGWAPLLANERTRYREQQNFWVFVPQRYICHSDIFRYRAARSRVASIYHRSNIINNYYDRDNRRYTCGPRVVDIERATRSRVRVYDVYGADKPGRTYADNRSIRTYRPEGNNRTEGGNNRNQDNGDYDRTIQNRESENTRSRPSRETSPTRSDNYEREKSVAKEEPRNNEKSNVTEAQPQSYERPVTSRPERRVNPRETSYRNEKPGASQTQSEQNERASRRSERGVQPEPSYQRKEPEPAKTSGDAVTEPREATGVRPSRR